MGLNPEAELTILHSRELPSLLHHETGSLTLGCRQR